MKRLMAVLPLLLLCGCVSTIVPRTKVVWQIGDKKSTFECPKDADVTGLTFTQSTNGEISLKIQTLKTRMNPDVITTSGDAQVRLIKTAAEEATKAALAGAAAVATGGGAAVIPK